MKLKIGIPSLESFVKFLRQYKFVLIVIAAGLVLLALPTGGRKSGAEELSRMNGSEALFSIEETEEKLGRMLSRIEGAGEVTVMLTVQSGMKRILVTDREASQKDAETELEEKIVILSTDAGEEPVLLQQYYPTFQGALVVCQGGDDPEVQLQITRALSSLTGLGSGRITVCKGS